MDEPILETLSTASLLQVERDAIARGSDVRTDEVKRVLASRMTRRAQQAAAASGARPGLLDSILCRLVGCRMPEWDGPCRTCPRCGLVEWGPWADTPTRGELEVAA